MKTLIPVGARVVVEQVAAEVKTEGGLVIPDDAANKNRPCMGKVLASGEGVTIAPGCIVVYQQYAGTDVEVERKVIHKVLNFEDILAVVKGD